MNRTYLIISFSIALCMLPLAQAQSENGPVQKAIEQAKKNGKLVFVKSGRERCGNCRAFDKLKSSGVLKLNEEDFIFLELDCDDQADSASLRPWMESGRYTLPLLKVIDSKGELLGTWKSGYGGEEKLNEFITTAKKKATYIFRDLVAQNGATLKARLESMDIKKVEVTLKDGNTKSVPIIALSEKSITEVYKTLSPDVQHYAFRTWTSSEGRSLEARLVGRTDKGARLLMAKERISVVPLERLSEEDQELIRAVYPDDEVPAAADAP